MVRIINYSIKNRLEDFLKVDVECVFFLTEVSLRYMSTGIDQTIHILFSELP